MGRLSKVGAAFPRLVAVAGPVLLGLLTALYVGRPSPYFLATGIALAVAIPACDCWVIARSMNAVFQEYAFDGGPYMGFTQSRDLYGDGSIVIVPAPGHTPGSVVVFITLSGGARYAFVGDLVWQLEGLLEREERPWFESRTLGEIPVLLRQSLLRMSAIATRYPQITIVPAHDPRGYASIPEWSRSPTR